MVQWARMVLPKVRQVGVADRVRDARRRRPPPTEFPNTLPACCGSRSSSKLTGRIFIFSPKGRRDKSPCDWFRPNLTLFRKSQCIEWELVHPSLFLSLQTVLIFDPCPGLVIAASEVSTGPELSASYFPSDMSRRSRHRQSRQMMET